MRNPRVVPARAQTSSRMLCLRCPPQNRQPRRCCLPPLVSMNSELTTTCEIQAWIAWLCGVVLGVTPSQHLLLYNALFPLLLAAFVLSQKFREQQITTFH